MAKPKQTLTQINPDGSDGAVRTNVFRRSGQFFAETVHELKRVQWPGRREVVNYTVASLLVCFIMGFLVWVFDLGVSKVMSLLGIGV